MIKDQQAERPYAKPVEIGAASEDRIRSMGMEAWTLRSLFPSFTLFLQEP